MRIERHDDVAVLSLEAGRANAIQDDFLRALDGLVDEALASSARALVITGYDRFFSGGLDLPALAPLDRAGLEGFIARFDDVMLRLFAAPRPVVAAVNGHAIAGGCVLALQADVRFMAAGAGKIGLNEVQLGIGLPDAVIETLRAQVPAASLLPIALEGRLFLPDEAAALGLVHEVVAPELLLPRAIERARALGSVSLAAFADVKRRLRAPALAAARSDAAESSRAWVDTWFSPDAQRRLAEAVARLRK